MATLTFVYAESTAVIGPLASSAEPHSWDLCEDHARRITVPRGWEMLRSERGFSAPPAEDYELTALAEAVREVGAGGRRRVGTDNIGADRRGADWIGADRRGTERPRADAFDGFDDMTPGRHRAPLRPDVPPAPGEGLTGRRSGAKPRPGRRGHLRVLPDPVD